MAVNMTSKERILRAINHIEADRVPIVDKPWAGTLSRWRREGMPKNTDWCDFFGVDKAVEVNVDISPRYEQKIIEETERYFIRTSEWGVTMKEFKEEDSTPEFLDYTVTTPKAWEKAKKQMTPDPSRINWKYLEQNYPKWKADGTWIQANFWFGFDVTHSWMSGTETILIAMLEDPDWVEDMFDTYLNMCMAQFQMILDAGYEFDSITWPDDMGYKNTPFFSPDTYRNVLKKYHKRAVDWAHERGLYARLHSCGDIMPLIDDVVDTGIDILNPIEIKAGMDAEKLKNDYGHKITLHGGTNAQIWDKSELIIPQIEEVVPKLMQNGGYIFATDHSIPNSVSLSAFRQIVDTVKRVGKY